MNAHTTAINSQILFDQAQMYVQFFGIARDNHLQVIW